MFIFMTEMMIKYEKKFVIVDRLQSDKIFINLKKTKTK